MREHTIRVPERELHRQVLAYVGRRVRNREDAEDIAQEVMLRVHRHSAELAHVEGVSAWVYRIAANGITDHYRRASRREVPSGRAADVPEPELDIGVPTWREPATDELRHSLASCLPPLVERLSPRYRHALELTDLEGFSQTEAAPRPGALSVGHEGARGSAPAYSCAIACASAATSSSIVAAASSPSGRAATGARPAERGSGSEALRTEGPRCGSAVDGAVVADRQWQPDERQAGDHREREPDRPPIEAGQHQVAHRLQHVLGRVGGDHRPQDTARNLLLGLVGGGEEDQEERHREDRLHGLRVLGLERQVGGQHAERDDAE